jgi:hypothetical protein
MRFAVLGMLMLFALGDGCSSSPNVVGVQDYGRISGRVLDAMTNRPIAGALVSVGSLYTATTDVQGGFIIATVPVGDQTVTARAPGYSTVSNDTEVHKEKVASVGYLRLVPVIHPEGQPTLPPPATPTPAPPPTAAPASAAPASTAPAATTPAASASPEAASPPASAAPAASPTTTPSPA